MKRIFGQKLMRQLINLKFKGENMSFDIIADYFWSKEEKKRFDNRDLNIERKNKNMKFSKNKFCDRFLKK